MGVYQRDSRYLVYWYENGKRHDKSFGRGEQARVLAEQFDQALKTARRRIALFPIPMCSWPAVQVQPQEFSQLQRLLECLLGQL